MEVFSSEKEKRFSYLVFGVYLLFLCWLVLVKLATSVEEIPHLRGFNLIPFFYSDATLQLASFLLREVIYNILVFIPAGFYFTALYGKKNPGMGVFITFILSLAFEAAQWIFSIGATDITDLITNTLGGICGMLLFLLMGNIWESRRMSIMNGLGMGAELLGGGFLTLMYVVR